MTTKEVKEYLSRYVIANESINAKLDHISQLKQLAQKSTIVLSDCKVSGSMSNDKIAEIVSKIVDMEHQVDVEIDALQDIKASVCKAIESVEDDQQRAILELKYINGFSWEEIAVKTSYAYRHVTRLHGEALQKMSYNVPIMSY